MRIIEDWLAGWIDIAAGIVCVITLTAYRPWWDMQFSVWVSKRRLAKLRGVTNGNR